jgi:hypothetical protein
MSYELQVYALSPIRPTPREILARIGEVGLAAEVRDVPGARPGEATWSKLLLAAADSERGGFLVEDSPELERMTNQFREDREAGENIPPEVFDSRRLYVLELDDESPSGEDHMAAFVATAWALAGLTEGLVFDPQEEFFADAESFWSIVMDETFGDDDDGCGDGAEGADEGPDAAPEGGPPAGQEVS